MCERGVYTVMIRSQCKILIAANSTVVHVACLTLQGRRKSGISNCPICEEEKGKRLECSDDGSSYIVYYYGNASQSKKEEEVKFTSEIPANSSPPPAARASSVIYYSQASLE